MKKLFLLAILIPSFAIAGDGKSYNAEINEEGKFCARVEIQSYTGNRSKTKCRTIEQWRKAGYLVSAPVEELSQSKKNQEDSAAE
jgi:hypothetical protein